MASTINCKGMALESLPPILTANQVSQVLGVSYKSTLGLIRNKQIVANKIGRAYRVTAVELLDYLGVILE